MRLLLIFVLVTSVGCQSTGGNVYGSDHAEKQAEEEAGRLAAPHEVEVRKCEAQGKRRDSITHYVAAIQALPEGNSTAKDFELREKLIRLASSLDPQPAISEDVQHILNRAEAKAKEAKSEGGWSAAALEYERALRYAPWEAQANYNAGLMYELLKKHAASIRYLKLYLLSSPDARDKAQVQKKIAELEVKAKGTGPRALVGIWRDYDTNKKEYRERSTGTTMFHIRIDVKDNRIVMTLVWDEDNTVWRPPVQKGDEWPYGQFTLKGRMLTGVCTKHGEGCNWTTALINRGTFGLISEDFTEIAISSDAKWHLEDQFKKNGEDPRGLRSYLIREK